MLPGDTKAMSPSGLRLGVQELTRHGMGVNEMEEVAECFRRVLIDGEEPEKVKDRVKSIRSNFQDVKYCFRD